MIQKFPSYVFQVGQSQFAVDKELAECIYVSIKIQVNFSCNFDINKYNMIQELCSILIARLDKNIKSEVNKMDRKKIDVETKLELSPETGKKSEKKSWKKPTLEDVSGKVMAQPYIRFT